MPGKRCAVASCENNQANLRRKGSNVIFHRFPKTVDSASSIVCKKWIHLCKRAEKFNVETSRICSDHFTPNDYERDLKGELLGLPLKKILKNTAVPTMNLGGTIKGTTEQTDREKRIIKKERKELINTLLASTSVASSVNKNPCSVGNSFMISENPGGYVPEIEPPFYRLEEMKFRQGKGRGKPKRQFANNSLRRTFQETAINNRVLRVHLRRENLESLRNRRIAHRAALLGNPFLGKRQGNSAFASPSHRPNTSSALSLRKVFLRKKNSSSLHPSPLQALRTPNSLQGSRIPSSLSPKTPSLPQGFRRNSPTPQQIRGDTKVLGRSVGKAADKQKTLNKVISKDKFKIKLFPQKVPQASPMKRVLNNGDKVPNGSFKLDEESMYRPVKPGQRFYLKFAPPKPIEEGKLGYDFHSLVADVKTLQLPGPTWKIKVIIKHNRIAALIFTNKLEMERSVSFNSDSDRYDIIIDNMPVVLLGSPGKVSHSTDIEVLLNIIQNIESTNPMILYK